jgi:hypothetical protein
MVSASSARVESAVPRGELDACYPRLYDLTRDELRYILDLKDVYGADPSTGSGQASPGETFRVLKDKEERAFGEYRTRRLVLEAWDRLEEELGPVVVRNYREEMTGGQETGVRRQETGVREWLKSDPNTRQPFNLSRLHDHSSARSRRLHRPSNLPLRRNPNQTPGSATRSASPLHRFHRPPKPSLPHRNWSPRPSPS